MIKERASCYSCVGTCLAARPPVKFTSTCVPIVFEKLSLGVDCAFFICFRFGLKVDLEEQLSRSKPDRREKVRQAGY